MNAPTLTNKAHGMRIPFTFKHSKRALFMLALCVALAALVHWRWRVQNRPLVVGGATARHAPLVTEWSALGYVECRTANVSAPQVGRIVQVWVREGDSVKAGQPLATLESKAEEVGMSLQREGVSLANSQVEVARATLQETARLQKDRIARAEAERNAARERLRQAEANLLRGRTVTQANLQAAQATLAASRAELANLQKGGRPEEIAQAHAEVSAAEASATLARRDAARYKTLYQQNAVARVAVEVAEETLARAEATLRARQAALELLRQGARLEQIAAAQARALAAEAQVKIAQGERAGVAVEERRVSEAAAGLRAAEAALSEAKSGTKRLETLQRETQVALARVRQGEAAVRQAKVALTERTLTAPFAGVVGRRYVDPGDLASPTQPLFSVVETDNAWIAAEVDAQDLAPVREGQSVTITAPAYAGREFVGKVARIGGEAIPQTEVRTGARIVRVRIALDSTSLEERRRFKPGMEALIVGKTTLAAKALLIPSDALLSDSAGNYVWVAEERGVQKRRVRAGYSAGRDTEILEGVQPGDVVIVSGKEGLQVGTRVTAQEAR